MLVAADDTSEVHPQGVQRAGVLRRVQLVGDLFNTVDGKKAVFNMSGEHKVLINREGNNRHLFVVGADEVEHKAPVHQRQQVVQEEGQTAVESLHKLHILTSTHRLKLMALMVHQQ